MAPKRKFDTLGPDYDNCRLFITNLSDSVTEHDLRETFSPHGDLEEVHLLINVITRASKGSAFIRYKRAESAMRARNSLDSTLLKGREMRVKKAWPRQPKGVGYSREDDIRRHETAWIAARADSQAAPSAQAAPTARGAPRPASRIAPWPADQDVPKNKNKAPVAKKARADKTSK